jgi:hypothetical protein
MRKRFALRGLRTWLSVNLWGFGPRFAFETAMMHWRTGREEFA